MAEGWLRARAASRERPGRAGERSSCRLPEGFRELLAQKTELPPEARGAAGRRRAGEERRRASPAPPGRPGGAGERSSCRLPEGFRELLAQKTELTLDAGGAADQHMVG